MPAPARPRDAASLLLLRRGPGATAVLMGRRPAASSFAPDAFVFPGGKVDPLDRSVPTPFPLVAATERGLRSGASINAGAARALANAAIRETYEETGLLLARPAEFRAPAEGTWQEFERRGLAPDHGSLRMIGRAITPSLSPVRYHARFLVANADSAIGELRANDELLDLDWYPLEQALALPAIDVTKILLEEVRKIDLAQAPPNPERRAFIRYRGSTPIVQYERN